MQRIAKLSIATILLTTSALFLGACSGGGGADAKDATVAATVNGRKIMSAEVEQGVARQAGGKQASLSPLQMAQARLQVLSGLIQKEVLFQRAEREKVLPTEDQITAFINQQKQESGMTDDDFQKNLAALSMTVESLREDARKNIAIKNLQDKYSSKITVNDKEVEDFYNGNKQSFVSSRGVALAMIVADPADNSASGFQSDAKNDSEAKLKIDNISQQLKGGADFATVARSKSEDPNTYASGGDLGFATEDDLKQNAFPPELVTRLFAMQAGDTTEPIRFNNGKWYVFKLTEKRLQNENLTLESPGVRQKITQALINQRKEILNGALLEVAMNEAKIINNMAATMLNTPSNLGLRPASSGNVATPAATPAAASTQTAAPSPAASQAAPASSPKQ
ncbi:MAG TPA: SurA N-terminal domain-containing protein [Pyrinomonadaceae bacterium]|nr:SurA N-terminal domain-containing protein [Pyrinomonadaceae bacterium]